MKTKTEFNVEKADIAGWKVVTPNETYYIGEYGTNHGYFCNEGVVYKNRQAFATGKGICYIPESGFDNSDNFELFEFSAKAGAASDIIDNPYIATEGYTRQNLIDLCGSEFLAEELFDGLDWMCPETLWGEFCEDSDEEDNWIESRQYYENFYIKEFYETHDKGMKPVGHYEFYNNEWQDKEYRKECFKKLNEIGLGGSFNE